MRFQLALSSGGALQSLMAATYCCSSAQGVALPLAVALVLILVLEMVGKWALLHDRGDSFRCWSCGSGEYHSGK